MVGVRGGDALSALTLLKQLAAPLLPYTMTSFEVVIRQCPRSRISLGTLAPMYLIGMQPALDESDAFTMNLMRLLGGIPLDELTSRQVFTEIKKILADLGVHVVDLILSRGKKSCTCPLS